MGCFGLLYIFASETTDKRYETVKQKKELKMQSIMKVIVLIAAMLILAMVLKALDSLSSNHRTKIDLNNAKTVQEGLAHYRELED